LYQITSLSDNSVYKDKLKAISDEIKQLYTIKDIFKTTKEIYLKKADEVEISIKKDIKREFQKALYIGIVALIFLSIFLGLKYLTRKYFSNKDSYYTINKAINIIFITIIILTLLFAYLENVSYLITILGFASAGIAIAMKDWFMSLLGWFVIVIGGAVHVGDRIKIVREGAEYVGDIVDISLLRMTIQEDITLTTYMHNRRAGRIIFIPNNYIFTDLIANYSHSGLKTVWDGIDFYITFDSNITKAMNISKNIAKQYSKGYTDITRKQLNNLRSKYQLKSANVEPRVFSFIEGYGMKVSVWYLTNAYATLTLRSTISNKIIEEILKEPDIEIAYPTQSLLINKNIPKPIIEEAKEV
jgi:small-conductance mechanosensitive channel